MRGRLKQNVQIFRWWILCLTVEATNKPQIVGKKMFVSGACRESFGCGKKENSITSHRFNEWLSITWFNIQSACTPQRDLCGLSIWWISLCLLEKKIIIQSNNYTSPMLNCTTLSQLIRFHCQSAEVNKIQLEGQAENFTGHLCVLPLLFFRCSMWQSNGAYMAQVDTQFLCRIYLEYRLSALQRETQCENYIVKTLFSLSLLSPIHPVEVDGSPD